MQIKRNMRVIKIWFEDFWDGFDKYNNWFTAILRKHYQLEFDEENPDYVFCSVFGQKALDYKGVRIIYVGENFVADFNKYDYVLGHDYIQYGDRYLRMPMKNIHEDWESIINKHKHVDMKKFLKRDFCCRVVSNGHSRFRELFYEKLSSVRHVASGGKYRNNLPQRSAVVNKKQFLEGYKFNLAFENSSYPGYCTEKIYDAWAAGCIPIYWGDPTIENWCNEDAFINCNKYKSVDEIIDYVLELEKDANQMEKMLRTPILKHEKTDEDELERFLLNIFSYTLKEAYRRNSVFSLFIPEKKNHANKEKKSIMNSVQVYSVLDGLIREEIDRGQTIGIYPFGKNGLMAKAILVERYGADGILLDNDLAQYNHEIISIEEFEKIDDFNITIILCATNPILNETLMKKLKQRKLKAHIRNVLDIGHAILYCPEKIEYFKLIKELCCVKKVVDYELIRVGQEYDGGYIMLDDFKNIKTAYSFGIGNNVSWEEAIIAHSKGLSVHCYDHTIEKLPKESVNLHFHRIGIAGEDFEENNMMSMESILTQNNTNKEELVLKMDVEGAEWDFLGSVSQETLKLFVQMTFELHNLTDSNNSERVIAALKKINRTHQAVWIHANNNCGGERAGEIVIPRCLEITYVKKEKYQFIPVSYSGPLPIDSPNIESYPDIVLKDWGEFQGE